MPSTSKVEADSIAVPLNCLLVSHVTLRTNQPIAMPTCLFGRRPDLLIHSGMKRAPEHGRSMGCNRGDITEAMKWQSLPHARNPDRSEAEDHGLTFWLHRFMSVSPMWSDIQRRTRQTGKSGVTRPDGKNGRTPRPVEHEQIMSYCPEVMFLPQCIWGYLVQRSDFTDVRSAQTCRVDPKPFGLLIVLSEIIETLTISNSAMSEINGEKHSELSREEIEDPICRKDRERQSREVTARKDERRPHLQQVRSRSSARSHISYTDGYSHFDDRNEEDQRRRDIQGDLPCESKEFEVQFDGDSDPLSPKNKTALRKWCIVLIGSSCALCVTCASALYTSTYRQLEQEFHVSREVATLGLTTFVVGLGLGPMILSPLSEFYGRRIIYLCAFGMFFIWLIPCAVANNIATMLVARFFDGLAGSAFLSVAGGTVGDMFRREKLSAPMMVYTASPFIGGGRLYQSIDKLAVVLLDLGDLGRAGMVIDILLRAGNICPCVVATKSHQVAFRDWQFEMESPNRAAAEICGQDCALVVYTPLSAFDPRADGAQLVLDVSHTARSSLSILWHKPWIQRVANWIDFLGNICGNDHRSLLRSTMAEERAWDLATVSDLPWLTFCVVLETCTEQQWCQRAGVSIAAINPVLGGLHFPVPIVFSVLFGLGNIFFFGGCFTFLVECYPLYAASALAANSFARSSFAAGFPLFGVQMYESECFWLRCSGYHDVVRKSKIFQMMTLSRTWLPMGKLLVGLHRTRDVTIASVHEHIRSRGSIY
nr:efflux pump atb [Quercus suber]